MGTRSPAPALYGSSSPARERLTLPGAANLLARPHARCCCRATCAAACCSALLHSSTLLFLSLSKLEAQVTSFKKDLVKGHEGKQFPNDKSGLGFNSNNKNKSTHKRKKGQGHVKDPAKIVCFKCKIEGHHVRLCPLKKKPLGEKKQGKRPQDGVHGLPQGQAQGLPQREEGPLTEKDQAKAPVAEKSSCKMEKTEYMMEMVLKREDGVEDKRRRWCAYKMEEDGGMDNDEDGGMDNDEEGEDGACRLEKNVQGLVPLRYYRPTPSPSSSHPPPNPAVGRRPLLGRPRARTPACARASLHAAAAQSVDPLDGHTLSRPRAVRQQLSRAGEAHAARRFCPARPAPRALLLLRHMRCCLLLCPAPLCHAAVPLAL
ncbi:hypothetical protein QYE76_047950 [Lolium multiflorum]|uniref:CCHC-type domain-containing protein n=1 Tax=Lolium multiflorum TaxID=4521 RepID=A0AAD8TSY8_LOLMU|nr:hypothetical protein QYE76_047950 [Lolium multiflorum]